VPRYSYNCPVCERDFIIRHSYKEVKKECPKCGEQALNKNITTPATIKYSGDNFPGNSRYKNKKGQVVTETIETTRAEIKAQKKELKNRKS
tara:strand:+ start:222 stop:494 length:273 start_codon:yes stop_codon:yes gene_type:complete